MTPEKFTIHIPDERLNDMLARIKATAWPGGVGNEDWSLGVEQQWLQDMAQWWTTEYDWRAREAVMNRRSHYRVTIEGQPIHYVLEKGSGDHPAPLVLTTAGLGLSGTSSRLSTGWPTRSASAAKPARASTW